MMRRGFVVALLIHVCLFLRAQAGQPDITFGSVKPEDFAPTVYSLDSSAEAVYLFDVGSAFFHETDNGHYEIVRQRHERIHILSANAFDMATLVLFLYHDEYEETVDNLEAATYNLKDGKVVAEPISKDAIFTEKEKGEKTVKLALPDVRVGSIIEFSYRIKTPGFQFPGWDFQGKYPKLWSRYEVETPYFLNFAVLKQGALSFVVDSTSTFHLDYNYQYYPPNEDNTLQHTWVMKDVPGIREEPFVSTIKNYVASIDFQLSGYRTTTGSYINIARNWASVCQNLMNNLAFGEQDEKEDKLLTALAKQIQGNDTLEIEKTKRIFDYVRDNYTCTYHYGKMRSQELRKTLQLKSGTEADLNLLLYALLTKAGVSVYPVILSTTGHGKIVYEYPTIAKYNYVICQAIINKKQYFLDASHRYLSFGKLDDECYNGYARIIDETKSQGILISPNSLNDSITTRIIIRNGDDKASITTCFSAQPSIEARKLMTGLTKENSERIIKEAGILNEAAVQNIAVKGMSDADSTLIFEYQVPLERFVDDVVYFSPLLSLQTKSNPFSSATRTYPVEMPYCKEEIYDLTMDIPKGYKIEELPKPISLQIDSINSHFNYAITSTDNEIRLHVSMKIEKAVYQPEDYTALRNFFTEVISKEAEQIVFKK